MQPAKQEFPQGDDIKLIDFFEAPHDNLLRYIGQFRAEGELYRKRLKEYEDSMSQDKNFECSFHIKREDDSESRHVGVLHFPKARRNVVGTIVAELVLLGFISNYKIKNTRNITIDDILIIKELTDPPDITYLDKLASPQ